MRKLIVDEKVEIWRRTTYEVSDDVTNEQFIERLRELSRDGDAFEIQDEEGVDYVDGEYLEDTELPYSGYGTSIEVFDNDFNSLESW